ncbi:hypothetical protein GGI21_002985 [Coemansia aciculifera]|nr:hypothetical protein GGI21_002985 [Coemansia aciculifera]
MLGRCKDVLKTIAPNELYAGLLEHVHNEVALVCCLVDWNSHIGLYNVVKSVTSMKHTKTLLRAWQDALPSGAASSVSKPEQGATSTSGSHSLLYNAFAKSSRIVQSILWGESGRSSTASSQGPTLGRKRAIVVWIACWVDFLTFKTTAYFQKIITPHRSLFLEESPVSAKQSTVLDDIWSRPGLPKTSFNDMVMAFLHNHDGCFVSLLFESSKQRPYFLDGFAVTGSKVNVPDYRVQACAVLFCVSNQKLLQARGHTLRGSLVSDVCSSRATHSSGSQQYDVDWFRHNCLPDILCVLDSDRLTLELELLGSSPLLGRLDTDADGLLVELCNSAETIIDNAVAQMAETAGVEANADVTAPDAWLSGDAKPEDGRPDSVLGPEDDSDTDTDDGYMDDVEAAAALHISIPRPDSRQRPSTAHALPETRDAIQDSELNQTMSVHSNEQAEITFDATHAQDASLSLYSTYLLKSHLRNNLPHDWQARNAYTNRHFVGRQSGRASMRHESRVAPQAERISSGAPENAPSDVNDAAAAAPVLARRKTDDFRASTSRGADARLASERPVTMHADSGIGSTSQVKAAQTEPDLAASDYRSQGARGSISSTNIRISRPSLSIRSFFQSTSRLSVPMRQQSSSQHQLLADQKAEESEVARRVRCGERLKELFGPWNSPGADEQAHDDVSVYLGGSSRRGSVHSLSYSTHIRTSLGAKTAVAATAAMPNTEARGGGFAHRLSRAAAPLVTSAAATAPIASRGTEHQFGPSPQQQRAWAARGQNPRLLQQSDVSSGIPAGSASSALHSLPPAAAPAPPMAGGGLEACTYLYSRVGLPNIVMVAVLLDTERGLGRRREAERAWDEIVDAVRGTSMLERLMSLPS